MIMSGLFLTGEVPFRNVVIHGLVRDPQGRKMSKSTGNIIDPLEVIERVGADPLRFGLAWQATEAQNIPFGEEHIDAGRRFANKVWNASRLVLGAHTGGAPVLPPLASLTLPERWLLSRHESCLAEVDEALDQFRFSDAAQAVHRFVWSEFCDWGLEMEKGALAEEGPARDHAGAVLAWVLERSLRILHPIMPFVTEEIWQRFEAGPSIVVAPWPERHEEHLFSDEPGVEGGFRVLRDLITRIRQARSDYDISPGTALRLLVPAGPLHLLIDEYGEAVRRMARLSGIEASDGEPGRRGMVRLPVEASEVLLDAGDAFDPDAARARIQSKLTSIEADADKGRTKLANPSFVERAPAEVRQKVESQVEDAERQAAALRERLAALG